MKCPPSPLEENNKQLVIKMTQEYYELGFRSLSLKKRYSSLDDILNDFMIPVLSISKYYYRASGYFSSSVLPAIAKGLIHFIKNGEKMYLITGLILSEDDIEAIIKGKSTPAEIIEERLQEELNNLDWNDLIVKRRLEVLAWLVAKEKLEIKIAVPNLENEKDNRETSLFHSKFAIFEDFNGDRLHIEGSINETEYGWTRNTESFSAHRSWVKEEKEFVDSALEEFQILWNNKSEKIKTYEIPEAVKKRLVKIAPWEIKYENEIEITLEEPEEIKLWRHQEKAIENWYNNDRKGIFSMATGSGKTLTALYATKRLEEDAFIILLVPTHEIMKQWVSGIKRIFREDVPIFRCSSNYSWKDTLVDYIWANRKKAGKKFIISTISSAKSDIFIKDINDNIGNNFVLIVDEVHRLGAKESRKIMRALDPSLGRLGLSATPSRIWDDIGTSMIMNYFGGIIYEYSIKDAIKDGIIVPYEYHVEFVYLTPDELEEYKKISYHIMKEYYTLISKYGLPKDISLYQLFSRLSDERDINKINNLLIKRARIIKKSINKIDKVIEIIDKHKDKLGQCLIYCDDKEQLESVSQKLDQNNYNYVKYIGVHTKNKKDKHLQLFKDGIVQFIVSIKCLDEGVDIPAADSAILVSSSRNPREFVQRRGRVLRLAHNKEKAVIYDLLVVPYNPKYLWILNKADMEIFLREIERSLVFLDSATDSEDTLLKITNLYSSIMKIYRGGEEDYEE